MLAKIFQKPVKSDKSQQHNVQFLSLRVTDIEPRVAVHYGIPSSASILAFDPIQSLLAIGTLDGRIKVIGGDNIEALLISPKPLPFKNLEFLQNQGFLVSVSNENEIQVWDLEQRHIISKLQWESNITAFSIICGSEYMYIGDEYGFLSVLKYDAEEVKIQQLPYHIPANLIAEAAQISSPDLPCVVGVLPQPFSSGNRVLIAYENGLIVLWDVTEDRAVLVRGNKDLQLKDEAEVNFPNDVSHEHFGDTSDHELAEKEISSLCWLSFDGSLLAVGYVDGDILVWDLSSAASTKNQKAQKSSNDVVKLQLSKGEKRLPVIVLHWTAAVADNGHRGQLFVYGGDEIGSEEVLTILILDWSSGIETLKCVDRVDLTLSGSFADIILESNSCAEYSGDAISLFVLTNPGQIHFYDNDCLSTLMSLPEKRHSVLAVQYPATIPTIEPCVTVGKLKMVDTQGCFLRAFVETASAPKLQAAHAMTERSTKWPLTGGVPNEHSFAEDNVTERIYIAGYQDGSVRIWDTTFPTLSLMFILRPEVEGIDIAGQSAPISALDFSSTLGLAIGNECGLVRLHSLTGSSSDVGLHYVTESNREVYNLQHENGIKCTAIFSLLNSPVRTLQYVTYGVRLAVGFECGQVAMIDISSLSVLFLTSCVANTNSQIVSLAVKTSSDICIDNQKHSENNTWSRSTKEVAFILSGDGHVVVMDSTTGNVISSHSGHAKTESTAISLYILEGNSYASEMSEKHSQICPRDSEAESETAKTTYGHQSEPEDGWRSEDSLLLVCCDDSLYLYSSNSVIQGEANFIRKVNLVKPCCWNTTLKRDEKECGLVLLYQTGVIEIRSLPELEVVRETSLMSILRWTFKNNMDKTISSSDKGQITLVNGCEFAIISLFVSENDFRIPEALPSLHDKVLAAAADLSFSHNQKKKQSNAALIFGDIIKGFGGVKMDEDVDPIEAHKTVSAHLEGIFSRFPFSGPSANVADDQEVIELNIDDIKIDEPMQVSSSPLQSNRDRKDKGTEREKLFEGGSTDVKPRLRTREEIIAKYRKDGDATSAAAHAKDKLVERQQKLEKLSKRTEELQSGAESFASMANELAKTMEKRKWWNI